MRLFLLLTTSGGALASLSLWSTDWGKWVWTGISLLSVGIAGYHTVMGYKASPEKLVKCHETMRKISTEAENLWECFDSADPKGLMERYQALKRQCDDLAVKSVYFVHDKKLANRCHDDIERQHRRP